MSSLFERITRTRRKPAEGLPAASVDDVAATPATTGVAASRADGHADPAETPTSAGGARALAGASASGDPHVVTEASSAADPLQPVSTAGTAVTPDAATAAAPPVPLLAGEDPADTRPTALRRGRLRKRMRFLEREHDLMLRDLGGLVYEIHRSGADGNEEHHRQLVVAKLERLSRVDHELRAASSVLGRADTDLVLREPGIGGLCPRCGEIFGSDARFCSACAFPVLEDAGPVKDHGSGAEPSATAEPDSGKAEAGTTTERDSGEAATSATAGTDRGETGASGREQQAHSTETVAAPVSEAASDTNRDEAPAARLVSTDPPRDRDMPTQSFGPAPLVPDAQERP